LPIAAVRFWLLQKRVGIDVIQKRSYLGAATRHASDRYGVDF